MPSTEDPDPLAALLELSIADREQAVSALLDSLGAEPQGASLLKRVRSAVDRRLRRLSAAGPAGWRGQGGLSRRPARPPPS